MQSAARDGQNEDKRRYANKTQERKKKTQHTDRRMTNGVAKVGNHRYWDRGREASKALVVRCCFSGVYGRGRLGRATRPAIEGRAPRYNKTNGRDVTGGAHGALHDESKTSCRTCADRFVSLDNHFFVVVWVKPQGKGRRMPAAC